MLKAIVGAAILAGTAGIAAALRAYLRFSRTRERLLAHLRRSAPDISVRELTAVGFGAEVLGVSVDVDLASLARRRPAGVPEAAWFDQVADDIRARVPVPDPAPFPLVQDRVMPLLKPATYVQTFERYAQPLQLAWRPFASGMVVTYVIANIHQHTLITRGMQDAWSIDPDFLHSLAVENLRRHTQHILAEIDGPRARYEHLDGFDATRILVADMIVPPGIADPVIAIPEETVLLIAPVREKGGLAIEARTRYAASPRPLSPRLFTVGRERQASVTEELN